MPNFTGPEGDLSDLYITETDILDRYVGNQLWLVGTNQTGQLGDNTAASKSSPVQTVSGGVNWRQVAASIPDNVLLYSHIASIKSDGTLWMWGYNDYGQLGDNTVLNRSSPVQTVSAGNNWKQIASGSLFTAAIKTDGTLWLWGSNNAGQLGTGTTTHRSSPVQTVSSGTNWLMVSCGANHTATIKTDGSLWLWGSNDNGRLGNNSISSVSSPVQTVSGGTNWKQVSCGTTHTASIKSDNTLWLWGNNSNGQLGDGTITHRSSPVQTIAGGANWKQVACGYLFTAAIKTDSTLWLWGYNNAGQLGTQDLIHRSSPVQTVSGGTNWKQVTPGFSHTASLKTDGSLWCWGNNGLGQLGDNTTTSKSSPVQTIAGGTNWKQVSAGLNITTIVTYTES